jgi:hypothetical protein
MQLQQRHTTGTYFTEMPFCFRNNYFIQPRLLLLWSYPLFALMKNLINGVDISLYWSGVFVLDLKLSFWKVLIWFIFIFCNSSLECWHNWTCILLWIQHTHTHTHAHILIVQKMTINIRGGNWCSRIGFRLCEGMGIKLYKSLITQLI